MKFVQGDTSGNDASQKSPRINRIVSRTLAGRGGTENSLPNCFLIDPKPSLVRMLIAVSLVATFSSDAIAQSDIAAQEFQRQQERERVLRQQQEKTPDVRLERPKLEAEKGLLPTEESPCFKIDRIVLVGDAAEKFQWALAEGNQTEDGQPDPAVQHCLGMRGINQVMRRMQNAIVKRGYVTTRVLATPQDLKTGQLTITLIPGRIRQIRFAEGTSSRATLITAMPAQRGDLLNLRDIEQALENFKRVPTAEADIQINPAEGTNAMPGESDLVIKWKQAFPLRLTVSADDSGTKTTGKYQGGVTVSADHLLTLNDLFYVSYNHDLGGGNPGDRGTHSYTVHYSLPFGYWNLGLTASENRYHQAVAGATQTYIYSGDSTNAEVKLSRLIYRDAARKATLFVKGWGKSYKNFIDDTEVEVQRRRMVGWDIGASHKEFIGNSTIDVNLTYRHGTGAFNSMRAPEENFGEGTSRSEIVMADAQLNVPFKIASQNMRYNASWRAQWNRTPLVPQDRFAIGSRYTVRGFDGETLLMGDRGWLIRNDLGWTFDPNGHELYLGLDHGEVSGQSSAMLVGTKLTGAVLGVRGSIKGVAYDVFVGKPISKPENFRTSNGVAGFNLNWSY
jgi:hemolysin activation/secretion protein